MKPILSLALVFLLAVSFAPVTLAQSGHNGKLINVVVTLSGDPVCSFIPEGYVTTNSPRLDQSMTAAIKTTEESARRFAISNCDNLIQKLNCTYGLLLKGFSCQIFESDMQKLKKIRGVKSVVKYPDYVLCGTLADAPGITGAAQAWTLKDPTGKPVTGTGQVIGIIDTGLDWRHPALGGKMGTKVIGGVDFSSNKGIESDPQSHGTSVAGAAAGNGKYKGTAPDAKLIGFKVYPETDGGGGDVGGNILKAVEQAVTMKCTVVNLSLGSAGAASGEEEGSDPYRNAVAAGLVICAAAGNNGARSDQIGFQVSSPSTIPPVISCAATDDTIHPVIAISNPDRENKTIITATPFDNPEEWPAGDYPVVDCGYGAVADFEGKDLIGKIALIERGPLGKSALMFYDKNLNAKNAGAIGCIIYNHSLSSYSGTMYPPDAEMKPLVPAVAITYTQGLKLKNLCDEGLTVAVKPGKAFAMMCDFSSMGPSTDLKFKPELSAPGQGVMCPVYMGKDPDLKNPPYKPFSGTSCATPVISGTCALMRQMFPRDPPQVIKSRMMSCANLLFNDRANEYIPLMSQGSGRVDVAKALVTKEYFNPPSLALKADMKGKQTAKCVLYNTSKIKAKASLSYWAVGKTTTCKLPDSIQIEPNSSTSFDIEIQCNPDTNDILEGIVFAKFDDATIHLPLIIANGKIGINEVISAISTDSERLDFKSDEKPTISFRINYGAFEPNTPGRAVTSTFAAGKLDVYDKTGYVGTLLFADDLQIGWYNIPWDGRDYAGRLFIPDGYYFVKGIGLETLVENDIMAIKNQGDPPDVEIRVKNSSLKTYPSVLYKTIPRLPRIGENFEIRFYCSSFVNAKSISFGFAWDKSYFDVLSCSTDTAFGRPRDGLNIKTKIDNDLGRFSFSEDVENDMTDDIEGFVVSITCSPKQDGTALCSLFDPDVSTTEGNMAPKSVSNPIDIILGYSSYDLNKDGIVDELDSDLLMRLFGVTSQDNRYNQDFDLNADGLIDAEDLAILSRMFGTKLTPP